MKITKKLPIEKQHLEQFKTQNLVYVDKTRYVYTLMQEAGYYFLSRPRRFGKSLFIDTLKQAHLGKKNLFEGLWIYDKINWTTYPVIHIDFSILSYRALTLETALLNELNNIAKAYDVQLEKNDYKSGFRELIEKLSQQQKVVILIDEYDKPITDYITNLHKANEHREILRDFYGVLKPLGNHIQLLFITGIAKFARISLFSVINHLIDLTFNEEYAAITGITPTELTTYFGTYLEKISQKLGLPVAQILVILKKMYDGYSWDGVNFVYNPFSILNFLHTGRFKNYWFKTGTPKFLIDSLKGNKVSVEKLATLVVDEFFFDTFDSSEGIVIEPLLFQTGYLTIKKTVTNQDWEEVYHLGYPNQEVKKSFLRNLLEIYTLKQTNVVFVALQNIKKSLRKNAIETFRIQLNILLSDISYHLFPFEKKDSKKKTLARKQQEFMAWEGYFQTIIYLVLQYLRIDIRNEVTKHKGRIDAIVEVENYLYIMEYKLGSAESALKQIKDNQYANAYRNTSKTVVLMGIAFDQVKKEVKKIKWEIWDKKIQTIT